MQDTCTLHVSSILPHPRGKLQVYACLTYSLIPEESSKCTRVLHTPSSQMKAPSIHVSCMLPHPRGKLQVYTCLTYSLIPEESSKCTRVLHTPSSQRKAPSVHVSCILPHPRGKLQVYTCLAYSLIPDESSKCTRVLHTTSSQSKAMQNTCTLGAFLWDEGVCKTRVHLELSSGMREYVRHVYTWSFHLG
jgi:hypothetical protein